jgi:hypothetical protein
MPVTDPSCRHLRRRAYGWVADEEQCLDCGQIVPPRLQTMTPRLRRAIFRDRQPILRVSGTLSPKGMSRFELARHQLRELYREILKHPPLGATSDGDVIEFLCRGEGETRRLLEFQADLERRVATNALDYGRRVSA